MRLLYLGATTINLDHLSFFRIRNDQVHLFLSGGQVLLDGDEARQFRRATNAIGRRYEPIGDHPDDGDMHGRFASRRSTSAE